MNARKKAPAKLTADREIVITRVFDAPRELVWNAMTDSEQVAQWWGPNGFTTTIETMEVRTGGVWKHTMHGPDGTDYPNSSVFKEIVKPERIVYAHGGGKKGGPGAHFVATWTFGALSDKQTEVTIRMVFESAAERDHVVKEYGAIEGGKQTLARLAAYLPKMALDRKEFVITRSFDAPRELVFKAWTNPLHLAQWWGPRGFTNPVCEWDARRGGKIYDVMRTPDGIDYPMGGEFREVVEPERLVLMCGALDKNGKMLFEFLHTVTFAEHNGKTTLTIKSHVVKTTAGADKYIGGFEVGMTQSLERLAEHLINVGKE